MMRKGTLFPGLAALALVLAACAGNATSAPGASSGSANVKPAPGASFSGAIDVGDKASSGALSFKISADGASITDVNVTLNELKCDGLSLGRIHDNMGGLLISMTDGQFSGPIPTMGRSPVSESENYRLDSPPSAFPAVASLATAGQLEGKFSSATQASGTIKIFVSVMMTDRACELGTFPWKAEAP